MGQQLHGRQEHERRHQGIARPRDQHKLLYALLEGEARFRDAETVRAEVMDQLEEGEVERAVCVRDQSDEEPRRAEHRNGAAECVPGFLPLGGHSRGFLELEGPFLGHALIARRTRDQHQLVPR